MQIIAESVAQNNVFGSRQWAKYHERRATKAGTRLGEENVGCSARPDETAGRPRMKATRECEKRTRDQDAASTVVVQEE